MENPTDHLVHLVEVGVRRPRRQHLYLAYLALDRRAVHQDLRAVGTGSSFARGPASSSATTENRSTS